MHRPYTRITVFLAIRKNRFCFLQVLGSIDGHTGKLNFRHADRHAVFEVSQLLELFHLLQAARLPCGKIKQGLFAETIHTHM